MLSDNEIDSDTELICYKCNNEYDYSCKICCKLFCNDCKMEYVYTTKCSTNDCFYCRELARICFSVTIESYCHDCVPGYVKKEILHERYLKETEHIRKFTLKLALKKAGLELRDDSKLCWGYIQQEIGHVNEIVERMCQMKFLFEYHNARDILGNLKDEYFFTRGWYDYQEIFNKMENIIIQKFPYPKVYPWQLDKYARIIQRNCQNWLYKPITSDLKHGIHLRLGLRDLEQFNFL